MSNPYAIMKQSKPQTPIASTTQLPDINKTDKDKMGRSMKRRMSLSHNMDIGKVMASQHKNSDTPALPLDLLNQYQDKQLETPPDFSNGLQRTKSHIRSFSSQRKTSVPSSIKNSTTTTLDQPIEHGVDLHDLKIIKILHDPEFNAEMFISSRLSDATATDIERFSSHLITLNKKINNDMKSAALKTYDRLLNTSNELHLTESELKVLRNLLTELLEVSNTMKESAETRVQLELEVTSELMSKKNIKSKKMVDRSSVIMLEKIWNNEMNSLFKHVEGAQKFVTPIPGRHIIAECGHWYELNAATFKTLQPAHIFLLNDLILVATRRRKNAILKSDTKSTSGLIAEQCWPLRDVTLSELKPNKSSNEKYSIKITYNSLTYIYQTDRLDYYQLILKGYKKSRDELRDILEAENIKQKQLRDSLNLLSIQDLPMNQQTPPQSKRSSSQRESHTLLHDISTKMHGRSRSLDNSIIIKNLKLIDENLNDIDILIFHENFDEAIDKLIDLNKKLENFKDNCNEEELIFQNVILMKINLKKDELLKKLITLLNLNSNHVEIEQIIRCLNKLNHSKIAQTLFLNNRSLYLNDLVSKVQESKDLIGNPMLINYLIEVSIVVFQAVKNSINLYKSLFKNERSSNLAYLIQWTIKNVKSHLIFLQKKINNLTLDRDGMERLITTLHRQSNVLKDVGIDVEFALDNFYKSINST